jgi:hypothetical protein
LQWGKEIYPQVQWAKPKWLVACIVWDWMDRQTNYIINNFTNMQIWVYLPDLSQIGEWFENIDEQLNNTESNTGNIRNFFSNFWSSWDGINNSIDTFSGNFMQTVRNYTINQSSLQELSDGVNNPFDQLAKMFKQTPLIRINTVDVAVSIPMIYAEDIVKYESYLKTWIQRNNETIKDWQTLVQWTLGICGKDYSLNSSTIPQINNNELLTREKVKQMYQHLNNQKDIIVGKVEKMKLCEELDWSPTSTACISLMQSQWLNITNIKTVKQTLLSQQNINNQCMGLLFDINWDLSVNFQNLFSIMEVSSTLENNIRANIKTLDQYKRFPLQLYQWVHVVDRYLSEITTTVDNFLWSLTLWLNTNATRFEQYVDAIIAMSTALQTRQAILDLSVDWQKKCSTCTMDNYDAYACSLGMLCGQLKLPILRLPPFKIPNIYIDLSHIDVGMDINLPKFQFTPTSVPLVELPNLPQPPSIIINGDLNWFHLEKISFLLKKIDVWIGNQIPLSLPTIPLLPSPPILPELPSFIPNINIELPVLPPAPQLPKIAPEINTVIKSVSFFSELYCIVKWWIGLVGESNVKTRIEQLTQRTYEIPLFDNINLSKDMSYQQDKLEGFDFQIDAYVNFTMNFNGVYSLIQWLADTINKQTKKLTQREWDAKKALKVINENSQDINDITQQNITIDNPLWFKNKDKMEYLIDEQKNIKKVAQFLINDNNTPIDKKEKIVWLIRRIDQKSQFTPQTEHILALQKEVRASISTSRQSLHLLQDQIKDYDSFVDIFTKSTKKDYILYSGKNTFSTNLFDGDLKILKENNNNVMKDYIGLQKTLLSHYKKWLKQIINNNNKDVVNKINKDINYLEKGLEISENIYSNEKQAKQKLVVLHNTYNAEKNLIYNNQAATCSDLWNFTNTRDTIKIAQSNNINNSYPYFWATAQVGWSSITSATSASLMNNLYDFSEYKNKLMLLFQNTSNTGSTYVDVLRSEYFAKNNKWYEYIDVNDDNQKDLIRRDTNNVWIKYGKQNTSHILSITNTTTNKYIAPVWNTADQREKNTNDGYLSVDTIKVKIYNKDLSVKNLRVRSQDYDSFTLSWTASERQQTVDWYLLEINKIPDLYHLKWHNDVSTEMKSRYVLFVPEWKKNIYAYLSIKNQLNTKSLDSLLTGTLLDIVEYNNTNKNINYSFKNISRARYYTRIVSLQAQGDVEKPVYTPSSPWSHHVVAGQQIIADNQWPLPQIQLQRVMTNTIVDSWLSPQWLVNTRYNILIEWEDPNGVIENWIETSSGQILSQISGSTNVLSGLYFDHSIIQNYRIWSRDNDNNITREQFNLTINTPTVSLDDIIYENTPINGINILSSITQGMDDGVVKFERKRNNVRTLLSNNITTQWFVYPLVINQTTVTWWLYNQWKNISFFAPDGNTIATMNKDNGAISITPIYSDKISKKVDLTSNTPIITLYDTTENRNIFTIKQNFKNSQLSAQNPYEVFSLSGAIYGSFAWGMCIRWPEHNCMVIVAPNGLIVIPSPYHTSLLGDYNYENAITTINFKTPTWISVGSVSFNAFIK